MKRVYDYDLIVIGAGIAGMVSAVTANSLGKRVAVVEKSRVGGNCTNLTCIPSKALIRLGHVSRDMAHLECLGLLSLPAGGLDRTRVMAHIRGIVQKAYEKDLPETFERIGIRMISAPASFIDAHHIHAGAETLSARKFIIATGTSPFIPEIPGLAGIDYLTNESLYKLDDLPQSLIILGGGVDGLEYASAFGRLGVETTVVEMAPRLLPMADGEVVNHLLEALRSEGIRMLSGTKAMALAGRQGKIALTIERQGGAQEEILAESVLVAVGRKPDLEGLCLEKAGVEYNARGIVLDNKLKTSVPHIYACGDIAGPYQLATTAEAQGIVAATNACLPVKRSVDYRNNVYVIFTEPTLAWVGLTEEQAREKHGRGLRVYRFAYGTMRRALIDGTGTGMAKFVCDSRGRIVGAHILGEAAAEVIHEAALIRAMKRPLHAIQAVTHAYPTYAQALVGRASQLAFLDKMAGNPFVKLALHLLPGYANRLHLARERLAETSVDSAVAFSPEVLPADQRACIIEARMAGRDDLVLDIQGVLDGACEEALTRAFEEGIGKSKKILLTLSGLLHMDTEGAGALVANAVRAARRGADVAACRLSGPLRDVFRLTRLDEFIAVFDSEGQALGASGFSGGSNMPAYPYQGPLQPGWARSVERLSTGNIPDDAMNINVQGKLPTGPVKGFGRLWDKRYRLRIESGAPEPREIVSLWKSEFPDFWPEGNRFFPAGGATIAPGTVAVLNLRLPGGLVVATGLMVLYVSDTSFSFISIQGHIISGWITFSSFREGTATIIQVHPLFRAGDPLMELSFRLGAGTQEDLFWHQTLGNLAGRLGLRGAIEQRDVLVDPGFQWSEFGNIGLSAPIRSSFYMPFYVLKKALRR
jgi:anti-anti-sigma factor